MLKNYAFFLLFLLSSVAAETGMAQKSGSKVTQNRVITKKKRPLEQNHLDLQNELSEQIQSYTHRDVFYNRVQENQMQQKGKTIDYSILEPEIGTQDRLETAIASSPHLKYRRSSLYTLMLSDSLRPYNAISKNAFGNISLDHQYNSHNLGPYLIPSKSATPDKTGEIEHYLNSHQVAKQLVSRWFNRSKEGYFNMDLVANRGVYNASELDISIALHSHRGQALLKDAGEELIRNTFIIVYDVAHEKGTISFPEVTLRFNIKAYLYRLIWDDATATQFYTDYWVDVNHRDPTRIEAFENSSLFKLQYIGSSEVSSRNVSQNNSLIYANVITQLFHTSMVNLSRTYESFRVKFPLYNGNPITAKIGKKEGLQSGDTFEVLEQILESDGTTTYQKLGEIKINSEKDIWDNTSVGDWFGQSTEKHTVFKGNTSRYQPGMLIRQIK